MPEIFAIAVLAFLILSAVVVITAKLLRRKGF